MAADDDDHGFPPRLHIDPPLFNSANPWATTLEQLRELYRCASTGAVTTRTALLGDGFPHDEALHRFAFFEVGRHLVVGDANASLNTLGYSPIPLDGYLGFIRQIDREENGGGEVRKRKPFIVSVTGTPDEVAECYRRIARTAREVKAGLAMEVNLSCPNIPGKPPPAYEGEALREYVSRVAEAAREMEIEMGTGTGTGTPPVPWGLKTPPYTHAGQFEMFVRRLRECALPPPRGDVGAGTAGVRKVCPVSFVTATNTLGSCLLLEIKTDRGDDGDDDDDDGIPTPALPGLGIGGLAGAPLHPLALGNVATLRRMLDLTPETRHVALLGIGGVADADGFRRMRSVGAAAVGVGTALGVKGVGVFGEIEGGLGGDWGVYHGHLGSG
ncbi:hypothetical protein GGR55DRAFT_687636 [Xylaria sp. FL0064]|nr:hypothetical protein GGR55DRAFT_687636 [Xylaria sp. FL0064]